MRRVLCWGLNGGSKVIKTQFILKDPSLRGEERRADRVMERVSSAMLGVCAGTSEAQGSHGQSLLHSFSLGLGFQTVGDIYA